MREIGAHHVQALASGFALADEVAAEVLDGAAEDLLGDDVAPALFKLAQAGVLLGTLTNGSHKTSLAALKRAGLLSVVDELQLEAAGAHAWKPHPDAYRYALTVWAEHKGIMPEQLLFVTAHPWDVHGAANAGLQTVLVWRSLETSPPQFFRQPTYTVSSFHELADLVSKFSPSNAC